MFDLEQTSRTAGWSFEVLKSPVVFPSNVASHSLSEAHICKVPFPSSLLLM